MAQPRANARRWFAGLTALFDAIMAEEKLGHSHFYTYALDRILAAAIVAFCASLALSVRARLNRRVENEPAMTELVDIVVFFPRCRGKQQVQLGGAVCSRCGLRITISVEEPRCPTCEYLLFGLNSDRCPECGSAIASKTRSVME